MVLFGTITIKIYDLILDLDFENIWIEGFKVGLIAWALLLIYNIYHNTKSKGK